MAVKSAEKRKALSEDIKKTEQKREVLEIALENAVKKGDSIKAEKIRELLSQTTNKESKELKESLVDSENPETKKGFFLLPLKILAAITPLAYGWATDNLYMLSLGILIILVMIVWAFKKLK
ncbi:hypothetical protein ACFLZ7_00060 [Nanoarchaeota archaeon]